MLASAGEVVYNSGQLLGETGRWLHISRASNHSPSRTGHVMSATILSAISHLPQLRGSLRHTAQRLAYFADGTGKVRKSYSFLAKDMHVSERTVKRHVARLQAMLVITKDTTRLTLQRYATNVYTFLFGIDHLHKRTGDRLLREEAKREKSSRAREESPTTNGLAWLCTVGLNASGDFLRWCAGEEARL